MITLPFSADRFHDCALQLIELTHDLAARGFTPATSSNFSMRLDDHHVIITVSGRDKGRLTEADFLAVNMRAHAVASEHRPSAETLLHTQVYLRFPDVNCVLHTHSLAQTVASKLFAPKGCMRFEAYELLKAFPGVATHQTARELVVLPNHQDMIALAELAEPLLDSANPESENRWGYLIDGHGLYSWGRDIAEARRHLEAFEFLIRCELEMRRLS